MQTDESEQLVDKTTNDAKFRKKFRTVYGLFNKSLRSANLTRKKLLESEDKRLIGLFNILLDRFEEELEKLRIPQFSPDELPTDSDSDSGDSTSSSIVPGTPSH